MAGGRPTAYKAEYAAQAKKLCRLGATNYDLAEFFGVTFQTINNWRVTHEEFFEALKLGKEEVDQQVERSLFQRAMGYTCNEDDIRVIENKIVVTPTIKHYPPDTTAMIFWLKNRKSAEWRDKTDIEHSGVVAGMSDEQIEQKIRELSSKG